MRMNDSGKAALTRLPVLCVVLTIVAGLFVSLVVTRENSEQRGFTNHDDEREEQHRPIEVPIVGAPSTEAAIASLGVDSSLGEWRSVGPWTLAGKVYALAQSYQHQQTLYVSYGEAGIYKTTDGGSNWYLISDPWRANQFVSLDVYRNDDNIIAASTNQFRAEAFDPGIHISRDGGQTWRVVSPPATATFRPSSVAFNEVKFAPNDPNTIYLGCYLGLFKTTDGGSSWTLILGSGAPLDRQDLLPTFAIDPTNSRHIVLQHRYLGIQQSFDGGTTWSSAATIFTAQQLGGSELAWAPSDAKVLYLLSNPGVLPPTNALDPTKPLDPETDLYRSTDGGTHWQFLAYIYNPAFGTWPPYCPGTEPLSQFGIDVNPVDPNHVVAANCNHFASQHAFTDNYYSTYTNTVDILVEAFDHFDPTIVYVGGDQGLRKVTQGGFAMPTAARIDNGVRSNHTFSVAVSAQSRRVTINYGDGNSGPHVTLADKSTDGASWTFMTTNTAEYNPVWASPINDDLLFTGGTFAETALVRTNSADGGAETADWVNVDPVPTTTPRAAGASLAFHPSDENSVIVTGLPGSAKSLYRSTAAGGAGTWHPMGPVTNVAIRQVAYAPNDGNTIYALEQFSPRLWYSTDAGSHWTSATLPYQAAQFAIAPADATRVLLINYDVFLDCREHGNSCTSIPRGALSSLYIAGLAFSPTDSSRYFLTVVGGPVVTNTLDDNVTNWAIAGHLLPNLPQAQLLAAAGRLYVASNAGVWEFSPTTLNILQPAVSGLSAKTDASTSKVGLTWTAASEAAHGYKIVRDGVQVANVFSPSANTFLDRNPVDTNSHCYNVLSVASNGDVAPWQASKCAAATNLDRIFQNGFQP